VGGRGAGVVYRVDSRDLSWQNYVYGVFGKEDVRYENLVFEYQLLMMASLHSK